MDPIIAYTKAESTRAQLQLAVNILQGLLTNQIGQLDHAQQEKVASAIVHVTEVEQWLMTWQESLEQPIHELVHRKPKK